MPEPGDLLAAFSPQPGRRFGTAELGPICKRTHCYEPTVWKGQTPKGRTWYVEPRRAGSTWPKLTSDASDGF